MTTANLVADFERRGVRLSVKSGQLHYHAVPGAMTPDLRAQIAEHRAEIITALSTPTARELESQDGLAALEADWRILQSLEPHGWGTAEYELTFARFTDNLERYEQAAQGIP